MFRVLFNHLLPFALGCLVGLAGFYVVYLLTPTDVPAPEWGTATASRKGSGYSCRNRKMERLAAAESFDDEAGSSSAVILSKPRATYTDLARRNNTEGKVVLKVTLQANGEVGAILVERGLPYGLTERAIAAARRIEFVPERVAGAPVSVNRTIEYSFDIY